MKEDMRYISLFFFTVVFLAGCNARHAAEIMRLQDAASNKKEQIRVVRSINKRFDALLAAVRDKTIDTYKTKEDFLEHFGEPIFIKRYTDPDGYAERWLYRYAEDFWRSDKIYIYFDAQGKAVQWEHQPPPAQEQGS